MPRTDAIDLSHWNGVLSFDDVKRAGVVGVIHKATEGESYTDDDYPRRRADATKAGLLWGAYHFMKPGDMRAQMEHFVAYADLPPGSRMALDHEDPMVPLDDLRDAVLILKDIMDCEVAIYSGHVIKDQLGNNHDKILAERTSLWLAQYTSGAPSWPQGTWPTYSLWQWTDQGRCDGIDGDCDLNQFNGDKQACARWFGPVAEQPVEASVRVDIAAPPGINILITVNGEPIT